MIYVRVCRKRLINALSLLMDKKYMEGNMYEKSCRIIVVFCHFKET